MFQLPISNLFRLIVPNCAYLIERNLCRVSTSNRSLHQICLSLLDNKPHQLSARLTQPLSVCFFQQRFRTNIKNENLTIGSATKLEPNTSANLTKENMEEEEDDILYKTIQIEARCADRAVLDSYQKFVSMSANYMGITISRVWEPFRTIKRRTLLRSAFVKKKYRVQYEWRTYYRCVEFKHLTGSTADTFLEYIERNLPESVALKVVKQRIETIPSHLAPPGKSSS